MKTENKKFDFDTVKFFRKVKEKIAKETKKGMNFEQYKKYLKQNRLKTFE